MQAQQQMRPTRPTSQTSVRSNMNARPITGQSGAPAQPRMPVGSQVPGRPAAAPQAPMNQQATRPAFKYTGQGPQAMPGQPNRMQVSVCLGKGCLY